MATFEVKVPNDDEGESLGEFVCESVPRIGERFCISGHPRVCRTDNDCFIGIVDDVQYEVAHPSKVDGKTFWAMDIVVWLREEHAAPRLYCDCSVPGLTSQEGMCEDCGHKARKG